MTLPPVIALASIAALLSTAPAKPKFVVRLEGHNAGCDLLVNDIPAVNMDHAGISNFPINPWLIDGRNNVTVRSRVVDAATRKHPEWDKTAARSCTATVSEQQEGTRAARTIARAEVKPSESAPVLSGNGAFTVTLGYPSPQWTNSASIGKDPMTQKRILARYREFHRLLATKDLPGLMKMSAVKFRAYATAMNAPEFESAQRASLKAQLASSADLIGLDVQQKDGLRYQYYYGGRLVSIKNIYDRSIIQYYDASDGVTTEYDLLFYYDGQEFVLIL